MPRERPGPNTMTVLMVDDNHSDIQLARIMMDALETDVRVHYVYSVADGISFLRGEPPYASAPRPDFVLLDLNMPGATGFDMLKLVRRDPKLAGTTVIVLTTSESPFDMRKAKELGANMAFTKPIDLDDYQELMVTIERMWLQSRSMSPSQ